MATTTTEGKFFLIGLRTLERIEMQFVPKTLDIDRRANYADVAVVGHNDPHAHFTGGKTTIPLTLEFYADRADKSDVKEKANLLLRFAHGDGNNAGPEMIRLVMGDLLTDNFKYIVTNVKVRYSHFQRHAGYLAQRAVVTMALQRVTDRNATFADVVR